MAGYFAAKGQDEIGREIIRRVEGYYADARVGRLHRLQWKAWNVYYGLGVDGVHASEVARSGEQGELVAVKVNHMRSLASGQVATITAPAFAWAPQAKQYEYESVRQLKVAKRVLEHYWANRAMQDVFVQAVTSAVVCGEGYVHTGWEGEDVRFRYVGPWDVIRNPRRNQHDVEWRIVRLQENRWDLAVKYPQAAEAIETAKSLMVARAPGVEGAWGAAEGDEDLVEVYRLYHNPSAKLPAGRDVLVLGDGTVLHYHDLEWKTMPVVRVSPDEQLATPFGYTNFFEGIGVQVLSDSLHSSVATNQTTFATQLIAYEEGTDPAYTQLPGGMSGIAYRQGGKPPEGINLTKSPPEVFGYLDSLKRNMELIVGMNSVARGESPGDRASGSLAAMLSAQAKELAGVLQRSYLSALRQQGGLVLEMVKKKATKGLRIEIARGQRGGLARTMEVTREDVSEVSGVVVDMGNELQQSAAGKIQMAEMLAAKGMVTPQQFMEVLETGRLEPVTEASEEEALNILRENEMLARGEVPNAMLYDEHLWHAQQHRIELSSPAARSRPNVVQAVQRHLQQHYALYYNVVLASVPGSEQWYAEFDAVEASGPLYHDRMLVLVGQIPPPPAGLGQPMPPPPEVPPEGGAPAGGGGVTPGVGGPQEAQLPRMPTNPGTGQQWNAVDGGGTPPTPAEAGGM